MVAPCPQRFIYLPGGGGGGDRDLEAFAAGMGYAVHFDTINYPGWQRYVQEDFSAENLIEELTAEITKRVPVGPLQIMGLSVGGHFGYAVGLRLQQMGREVALFCAIDSFMITSARPSTGWRKRAFSDAFDLLRTGRLRDLATLIRSRVWRALLRLAGGRLATILRGSGGTLPAIFRGDALAEQELSMRLLLREVAPWVAKLDRQPVSLNSPSILLRTRASASHDAAWKLRCPNLKIREVPGKHLTLFEPDNIGVLREAFQSALAESRFDQAIPHTAII